MDGPRPFTYECASELLDELDIGPDSDREITHGVQDKLAAAQIEATLAVADAIERLRESLEMRL
jgi:hypothetical protein